MGEWDIYCAICSGPLRGVRFTSGRASSPSSSPNSPSANQDGDDKAYDPSIVRKKETRWLEHIMVLAFYHNVPGLRRTYLATQGNYLGYEDVEAEENLPEREDVLTGYENSFECYRNGATHGSEKDPAYPFHVQCFKLLRGCWGGHPPEDLHHYPGSALLESSDAGDVTSDHEAEEEESESEIEEIDWSEQHPVDTDVLYEVMRELDDGTHLKVDYGKIWRTLNHHQFWESRAGEEVLVADPGMVDGVIDRIRTLVNEHFTLPGHSDYDLTGRVRRDPFKNLPVELLTSISWYLNDMDDIVNFGKASWYATLFLRGASNGFWREMLRLHTHWFAELQECLKMHPNVKVINTRALYLWVNSGTRPTRNLPRGHGLIRVANRRRIWKVCEDLADRCKRKIRALELEQGDEEQTEFEEFLQENSHSTYMPVVSHDEQTKMHGGVQAQWWIHDWEETYEKQQFVEVFFHPLSGFVAGISVSSQESEEKPSISERVRQTMGYRLGDPETGVIPIGDWVCGIILHIATIRNPLPPDARYRRVEPDFLMSPKGLTILLLRGAELHFGETSQGHPQKVLVTRPGHWSAQIVGIMGQLNVRPPDEENLVVFSRIGLVRAYEEDMEDAGRVLMETWINEPSDLDYGRDNLLWKKDYADVLGQPIWNHPKLRFHGYDKGSFYSYNDLGIVRTADKPTRQDLIPQEAFIWAKDEEEAKQLCRVSIYTKAVDKYTTDFPKDEVKKVYGITGFEAVYLSGERRIAGKIYDGPWVKQVEQRPGYGRDVALWSVSGEEPELLRSDLDIDGAGGEVISSIACMSPADRNRFPGVLEVRFSWSSLLARISLVTNVGLHQLHTNEGKVGLCVLADDLNFESSFIPEGSDFLVGMLLTFTDQLRVIAAITLTQ